MEKKNSVAFDREDELSDYRIWLSCIRERLVDLGMPEALELLERLDDAILQAIIDRVPPPPRPILN
jgi:hypothetical protein